MRSFAQLRRCNAGAARQRLLSRNGSTRRRARRLRLVRPRVHDDLFDAVRRLGDGPLVERARQHRDHGADSSTDNRARDADLVRQQHRGHGRQSAGEHLGHGQVAEPAALLLLGLRRLGRRLRLPQGLRLMGRCAPHLSRGLAHRLLARIVLPGRGHKGSSLLGLQPTGDP